MDQATRQSLLADVRNVLDVTWEDEHTDNRLLIFLDAGAAYLDDKLGAAGDYLSPGYPRSLLFEYVRYARDEALDVFENNYLSLILAMQNGRKVEAYGAEVEGP